MEDIMITICTPTYNRAHTIKRVYDSLRLQTYKNFEWVIVDDGSTDNTKDIIDSIVQSNSKMKIIYVKQENGGKHRAVNRALDLAKGKMFFIVDSDDKITSNALERIVYWENTISLSDDVFAGICCLSGYSEDKIIGSTFEGEYLDIYLNEIFEYGISGDRPNILYTAIFKKYKYPEITNEWHIAPGVPFVRMAKDGYKLRYFNEILYIAEYLEDGLTKLGDKKITDNFVGYTLRTREWLQLKIAFKRRAQIIGKYGYIGKQMGLNYRELADSINQKLLNIVILSVLADIRFKLRKIAEYFSK